MTLTAGAVTLAMLVFFVGRYILLPGGLERQTLTRETAAIASALALGEDPRGWTHYATLPRAYAFRVLDKSLPPGERRVSEANARLLPGLPPPGAAEDAAILQLGERFAPLLSVEGLPVADGWLLTSLESGGERAFWVQAAMVGDPAFRRRFALGDEIFSHVIVPALFLVPTLTLAMLLTVRSALQPLRFVAAQARRLGAAAAAGVALTPLSAAALPREIADVVGAVNAMLAELDHTLARQRQFASDAAHELRTPLAVLRLRIGELPAGPAVARLDAELSSLAHLVGQLLRFAQAEDVMVAERAPVDVVAAVRTACEDLAPVALAGGQELEFVAGAVRVMRTGHAVLLQVAVRNLVENALRASPPGAIVTIRVEPDARVIVEDRGPGVPEPHKAAVFGRLWRADRERRDGAGIGLALVRRIAQLHGGDVTVEDRDGGGARFVVRLG